MKDSHNALALAGFAVAAFCWWFAAQFPAAYWKAHMSYILHLPLLHPTPPRFPYTAAQAAGMFLVGLFLTVTGFIFVVLQALGKRKLGNKLAAATREAQHGLPGLDRFKRELAKR